MRNLIGKQPFVVLNERLTKKAGTRPAFPEF
jgi:hypothetical protein